MHNGAAAARVCRDEAAIRISMNARATRIYSLKINCLLRLRIRLMFFFFRFSARGTLGWEVWSGWLWVGLSLMAIGLRD